jgi:hypothetical protein
VRDAQWVELVLLLFVRFCRQVPLALRDDRRGAGKAR